MVQEISEIVDNEEGIRPIIVQFQNSELQEGEEKKLNIGLYKKSRQEKLLALATRNMLYVGSSNKETDQDDLYNRFLLVSNRKTGKVRLVAVDTVVVTAQFDQKESDVRDNPDVSINNLNKQFGSKKIKRMTEQRERLKMNVEDVKEQLEQTVAGVEIDENESFVVEPTSDSMYKPPINRNASTKEQVYVLQELVPDVVLDSLEEDANDVLSSDLEDLEVCDLVRDHIGKLQNSSASNVVEKCKMLLLLDCLIKYLQKPARGITKRLVICNSSSEVNNYILNNFSVATNTGRTRPLSYKDKTICYILVLAMLAFDYEINLEEMAKSMKLSVKKLQEVGKVLAFSAHSKNKNEMILKVPLPPPVSTSPRKRKRT